jgi:hypothetical protein
VFYFVSDEQLRLFKQRRCINCYIYFISCLAYVFFTAVLAVAARSHHIDDMKLEPNCFIMVINKVSAHANCQETTEK